MRQLYFALVFLVSSALCDLLIAVPESSSPEQQAFVASYINGAQSGSAQKAQENLARRQDTVAPTPFFQNGIQYPTSRSFSILQQDTGIGRNDKGQGLTITIKLDGSQLSRLQGQGSNTGNPYSQGQGSTIHNSYAQAPRTSSNYLAQTNSLGESNGGLLISNPFKSESSSSPYPNTITEIPLTESNGFLKSLTNLVKSQLSSFMSDSPEKSYKFESVKPQSTIPYQNYAIFTPISTQPASPQATQLKQNVANFLTGNKYQSLNNPHNSHPFQSQSQIQIAMPQNNLIPVGSDATNVSPDNGESPIYSAASAVMKTVKQIPSNLDLMFNDMGRVYRENLFSLRDKLSDMSSLMPGMVSSGKVKENIDPWLDGFGA